MGTSHHSFDVAVVGAGLAGLVAATEALRRGRRVVLVDQGSGTHLGSAALWSYGGLFAVDTPEQRRLGIRDSFRSAWRDWRASAEFGAPEDLWGERWAEAFVSFASGELRQVLRARGLRLSPYVDWEARKLPGETESYPRPGNAVPRLHLVRGGGPALVAPWRAEAEEALASGRLVLLARHRVDALETGARTGDGPAPVTGLRGTILEGDEDDVEIGAFSVRAGAVVLATGGAGGSSDRVRAHWDRDRLGEAPASLLVGAHPRANGSGWGLAAQAGGRVLGVERTLIDPYGVRHYDPLWAGHGVRLLSGPSGLLVDATGQPLPAPHWPDFDAVGTAEHLSGIGHPFAWLIVSQKLLRREIGLSGDAPTAAEMLTNREIPPPLRRAASLLMGVMDTPVNPVIRFLDRSPDMLRAYSVKDLAKEMNASTERWYPGSAPVHRSALKHAVHTRDAGVRTRGIDPQFAQIRRARASLISERLAGAATPAALLDRDQTTLVAIRLQPVTRTSLGGVETDLQSRVLSADGSPIDGLFAAGEVAGFGGGGMHGRRTLEGTFLGADLLTGRAAGVSAAR